MVKKKYNFFKIKSDKGKINQKNNIEKSKDKKKKKQKEEIKPIKNSKNKEMNTRLNNSQTEAIATIPDVEKEIEKIEEPIAYVDKEKNNVKQIEEVITFFIGDKEYAIDILLVKEIIIVDKVEKISNAEAYIEGLYNYRGEIIPLVNLGKKFDIETTGDMHIGIVCNYFNQLICIVTDRVNDVIQLHNVKVFDPPILIAGVNDYLYKIIRIYDVELQKERIISVLNFDNIFSNEEKTMLKTLIKN